MPSDAHPAPAPSRSHPATDPGRSDAATAAAPDGLMRAIVQEAYGSVDVLQSRRIPRPQPGPDEVLVAVQAAGLDRGTWHLMTGRPHMLRVIGFGLRRPKNLVPGFDVAGTVVEVGAAVTRFAPGDDVFGMAHGSFAEVAAARADKLAIKPANLTFAEAAVVPISAGTALQALTDAGAVQAGQQVLVIGASGGVGSYAVQLAKAFGAEVTGVCSAAKRHFVASLGADHMLDYAVDDIVDGTRHYDLVLDIGGNLPLPRLRRTLTRTGTLVVVGGEEGGSITGGFGRSLRAPMLSPFVPQRLTMLASKERAADLERLRPLLESGQVAPSIDSSYPLDRVVDAMRHLASGAVRGKVAITVGPAALATSSPT